MILGNLLGKNVRANKWFYFSSSTDVVLDHCGECRDKPGLITPAGACKDSSVKTCSRKLRMLFLSGHWCWGKTAKSLYLK